MIDEVVAKSTWTLANAISSFSNLLEEGSTSPVPFFHLMGRLKTTQREGWCQAGLAKGESIADHMYRMKIMVMLAPPSLSSQLRISRCIKMVLVHDMSECIVGDITPKQNIPKPEKARREASTMLYITESLLGNVPGGKKIGEEILQLFEEYESNLTLEAMFAHDVDKLEMVFQTVEYERFHQRGLSEFYHVIADIKLPQVREWAAEVLKEREILGLNIPLLPVGDVSKTEAKVAHQHMAPPGRN